MTVADLLEDKMVDGFLEYKIITGRLIALDGMDGKRLFDTSKNRREVIEKYKNGVITSLWADIEIYKGVFNNNAEPVMKCFVTHDSWESDEE